IIYGVYTNLLPYAPNYIDSPEVRGIQISRWVFYIATALSLLVIALWAFFDGVGVRAYFYIVLPFFVLTSTYYVSGEQRYRIFPDLYDKTGMLVKQFLSAEALSKTLIVGSEYILLFRTLFQLDNPYASLQNIPAGSTYDASEAPANKEWV